MTDPETMPLSDQVDGAPHPRETPKLIGQQHAEEQFLDVFASGRLHHSWLINGSKGVGKATLAWSIAKFLLATPNPQQDGGLFAETLASPQTLRLAKIIPLRAE